MHPLQNKTFPLRGTGVRSWFFFVYLVLATHGLPHAFGQEAIQSGFAVVTPTSGDIAGLVAHERLTNHTVAGAQQTIVPPSILYTSAWMLIPFGSAEENMAAIAIANPTMTSGSVNLVLTNDKGVVVLNRRIQLGTRGQFSRFVRELFTNPPDGFTNPLLLTIVADVPVAILGLDFTAVSIAPIPLTSFSLPTAVPMQPLIPPPTPSTPPTSDFIGGSRALVFPQTAAGGGWSTEIEIGNASTTTQVVRIDIFAPDGTLIRSIVDVAIPPGGVFSHSTSNQ